MTYRTSAVVTGVLLILGIVTNLAATSLAGSILSCDDYLGAMPAYEDRMLWAAFFQLITALGAAGIAISLYHVLQRYHSVLAMAAVGFRIMEASCYAISGLGLIALITLGREFAVGEALYLQSLGRLIMDVRDAANFVFGVVAFGLGAMMYSIVFYTTTLVPRWLTIWGFIGILLIVSTAVFTLFNGGSFAIEGRMQALAVPIALQELVLAGWLIVKGFNMPSESRGDRT